jgi:hypothetical protein
MVPGQQMEGQALGLVEETVRLAGLDLGHPAAQQGLEGPLEKTRPGGGIGGEELGAARQVGGEIVAAERAGAIERRLCFRS